MIPSLVLSLVLVLLLPSVSLLLVSGTEPNVVFDGKIGLLPRAVVEQVSRDVFGQSLQRVDDSSFVLQATVGNASWWAELEPRLQPTVFLMLKDSILGFAGGLIFQFQRDSFEDSTAFAETMPANEGVALMNVAGDVAGEALDTEVELAVYRPQPRETSLDQIIARSQHSLRQRMRNRVHYSHELHHGHRMHHRHTREFEVQKLLLANEGVDKTASDAFNVRSYAPDCAVLADLYLSTNGSNWQPINWGQSLPEEFLSSCCSLPLYGYACDSSGRVAALDLSANQLIGSIPPSLGNLSHLQFLDLFSNQLTGSIPSLGLQLQFLILSSNRLEGSIPESLGNLVLLQYLDLDSNELSGTIPDSLGRLTELVYLDLDSNNLDGSIPPSLGNLRKLQQLYLFSNQLTGPIPDTFGNLTQLQILYLFSNQLSGSIPISLGNLQEIQELYLFSNQLTGSIPDTFGNLTQLQDLYLFANQLTGSIPASLGNLTMLEAFLLNNNELSGELSCGSLGPSLTTLNLQGNALVGPIPSCFCSQNGLQFAFLGNNNFTSFPNCSLSSVILLDLSSNRISSFPFSMISGFSGLVTLDLSYNQFTGKFPLNVFVGRSALRSLSLAYNMFVDNFPLYLCNYVSDTGIVMNTESKLKTIDLSGNTITGVPGIMDYSNVNCEICSNFLYYSLTTLNMRDTKMPALFSPFSYEVNGTSVCSIQTLSFFEVLPFLSGLSALDVSSNDLVVDLDFVVALPLLSSFDIRKNPNARKSLLSYTNQQRFLFDAKTNYPFSTSMSCVQFTVGKLSFEADPVFFDYENCVCRPGFYGKPPGCLPCFPNADCSFQSESDISFRNLSMAFRESGNIIAQPGYYASPSVTFAEMMNNQSYPKLVEICSHAGTDLTPCHATRSGACRLGYVASVLSPFIVVFIVVCIWIVGTFKMKASDVQRRKAWLDRCRRSAIFLFLLMFMSAISAVLSSLSCTTDAGDGKSYLVYYPNERCSQTLLAVSSFLLLLYALVIPGVLSFLVWRSGVLAKDAKSDTRRMYVYSLLFGSYLPNRRWWELVVTLRRILFVAAYVTIPPLSEYRTMLVASVLVGAATVQAVATPYLRKVENSVEVASLGILLVNLVCSVQSQVLAVRDVDGAGTIVFLMNIGFSAILVGMLLSHFGRRWRKHISLGGDAVLTENLLETNGAL
eukprot:ANDGO_04360.mRNA.1 MDIS1-interacting receptor like kinase 2